MKWTAQAASVAVPAARFADRRVDAGSTAPALDPYLRWAELTEWRGVRRLMGATEGALGIGGESIDRLRVLVQAPADMAQGDLETALRDTHWRVAEVYKHWIPGTERLARHFTAELDMKQLPWLKSNPWGMRWELALPFRDAETAARAVGVGSNGPTRAGDSFRVRADEQFEVEAAAVPQGAIKDAIAVIDFGCPFLNIAFAGVGENTTRVAALWDQGSHVPLGMTTPWSDATWRMGYGRELSQGAMNQLLAQIRSGQPHDVDEAEAYRRIDYLIDYDDARRRIWGATHGSHVLDVAGGCTDPLTGQADEHASKAGLIFVQLPSLTGADSAGGSLSAQVLDGMRYVLDVCQGDARIVVNLSYGSFAGPHDGSSLIEQALDELLQARSGSVALVLGAGNAHQANCHLRRSVRKNRSALLRVDLPPGDFTDTFVEVWFDSTTAPHELRALRARVRSSEGDWCPSIDCGGQAEMVEFGERRRLAMLRLDAQVPNGDKPLLLLALAPTARPADDDGPLASSGQWEIELFLQPTEPDDQRLNDAAVEFDAWVERDDPGWLGTGVQPRFNDVHFGDADQSLSSLATGRYTIAVGGFRRDDGLPVAYSSTGSRLGPPVVYAACEDDAQQPNVRAAAVRSGDSLRMNGTSVAAPVFARRLFNWLAGGNTLGKGGLQGAIDQVVTAEAAGDSLVRHAHPDELARFERSEE